MSLHWPSTSNKKMKCSISVLAFKASVELPLIKDGLPLSCDHDLQQQPCFIRTTNPSITCAEMQSLWAARQALKLAFRERRVIVDLTVFRTKCKHYLLCFLFSQHTYGQGEIEAPVSKQRQFYFVLHFPFI